MGFHRLWLVLIFSLTLPCLMGYVGSGEWFDLKKMHEASTVWAARGVAELQPHTYLLQFDGGSRGNPGSGGSGAVLYENQKEIWNGYFYLGAHGITNNVAEYWGLVHGLRQCTELGLKNITVQGDSELILRQIQGIYQVKNVVLKELYFRAIDLMKSIPDVTIQHIPREQNKRADFLSNMAMDLKTSECNLSPEFIMSQRPVKKAGTAKGFSRPPNPPTNTIKSPTNSTPITIPTAVAEKDIPIVAERKAGYSHSIHIVPLIAWPKPRPTQTTQTKTQTTQTLTEHISVLLAESKRLLSFISITFDESNMKRLVTHTENNHNNHEAILKASDDYITDFLRKSRIKGTIIKTEDLFQSSATLRPPETETEVKSSCTYFIKILGTSQLSTKLNRAIVKLSSRLPTIDNTNPSTIASKKKKKTPTKAQDIPRSLGTLHVDNIQLFDLSSLLPDLKRLALTGMIVDRMLYGWAIGQSMMTAVSSGSSGEASVSVLK